MHSSPPTTPVPHTGVKQKTQRLTVTLGVDERMRLFEIAREQRTSVATVIRWAVDRYLDAQQKNVVNSEATESVRRLAR